MSSPNKDFSFLESKVRHYMKKDSAGHDWYHIERVVRNALNLARLTGARQEICHAAALLHDLPDPKVNTSGPDIWHKIDTWLELAGFDAVEIRQIHSIINQCYFEGEGSIHQPDSLEAAVVIDADRLDAIGAIGIARAFAYGGDRQRLMYDPNQPPRPRMTREEYRKSNSHTINHFFEKLLLLKDRMHTPEARKIAEKRHIFMENFLRQFFYEWQGGDLSKPASTPEE
ncbi:MAG: HD domain-containing protein [Bacteroidales bacterium]